MLPEPWSTTQSSTCEITAMSHRKNPIPTPVSGDTLDLEADHRRHAEIENAIRDLKYGVGLNHRAASPPTPPGCPSRSSPTIWLAGQRASVWASNW